MPIGVHVSKKSKVINENRKTMLDAIKNDTTKLNIKCCQIYTHGPRNSRRNKMDYVAIKKYCKTQGIKLYVHSSYITTGLWNINDDNKNSAKSKSTIKLITEQLDACDKLKSLGLVIHLPKKPASIITNSFKIIIPFIKKCKTPIMLEMTAVKPDPQKTYETPEKINNLVEEMKKINPTYENYSICVDTAHLWGAGIKVNDAETMHKWLKSIKHDCIGLFHLNAGKLETFNTGKDKHQVLFSNDDDIWKTKLSKSLVIISNFAKKNNIDAICEINRGDYDDIESSIIALNDLFSASS